MILTLTPNPSLDLLFEADGLVWDDANRIEPPRRRAGGQGINMVRAVRELGGEGEAIAPLGGRTGEELRMRLLAEGTPLHPVPIAGETRIFVGVHVRGERRSLLLNPRGPELSTHEARMLRDGVRRALDDRAPRWLAGCGSLAPGLPDTLYADMAAMARERGVHFVPDCDGPPLRLAAEAGCDLLVPNVHEAGRLLGRRISGPHDAALAAAALLHFQCRTAVVTLGSGGAIAADADGVWHAEGPHLQHGSAVGAGDSLLAALLLALENGASTAEALRSGVAAGTAVLLATGENLLKAADYAALLPDVRVRRIQTR